MKKTSAVIELRPSLTECVRDSPEQELKGISSNHSFDGNPHKLLALTPRREPFTLNGWQHSRERSSKSLLKTNRTKQFSIACHSISSTVSRSLNPQVKKTPLRTLQPKSSKIVTDLNFKCGSSERHSTKSARTGTIDSGRVRCGESMNFRQQLHKQKISLLQFYRDQNVVRRLMIDMAEPQQSINIIQYPLQMGSPRPNSKVKRKIKTYRRYFN